MNFQQLRCVRETMRRGLNRTKPGRALLGMIELYEL
jgi:hypothetical protein